MKSLTLKKLVLASFASLLVGQTTQAQYAVGVGGFRITGSGLTLVGTISTLSLADKHPAMTYIGWGLIVVGMLVNGGDLVIGGSDSEIFGANEVWNAMVREAKVMANHPSLIQSDSPIANAAQALNLAPAAVAQLTVDLDGAKTAAARADVQKKYFPNGTTSDSQKQALSNLVTLSRMG